MNNGVEVPQYWAGDTAQNLAALPGWDTGWRCKFLRPFKNFLVAGYISKSGTNYPHMIKWCAPLEPGQITAAGDWDEADPAIDAGERDLAETPDLLVDALPMGDQLIIYKERSMYSAQQSFDDSVFITRRLPGDVGLLARGCVVDTPVGHVVLTAGDLVVHQGQGTQSVLEGKWRKRLFQFIDSTSATRCFLTVNPKKAEVWVCYPLVGATVCTQALVWNWLTGAVGHRDLPNATYGATGQINFAAATTMNGLTGTMDDLFGATDANEFAANEGRLVICTTAPAIYLCDTGLLHQLIRRQLKHPGHRPHRLAHVPARSRKEREHELIRAQPRFGHQPPQGGGLTESTGTIGRKPAKGGGDEGGQRWREGRCHENSGKHN